MSDWIREPGLEAGLGAPAEAATLATLSGRMAAMVRDALYEGRLKPGDTLGTEKALAAAFGVSRMAARDAMKRLEAGGIVEIRVGAGGGARIARGNPRMLADALAVQLKLIGASVAEIMDAQRAVEAMTAELAALHANEADYKHLAALLDEAEARLDGDVDAYTRVSQAFHLAVAEASRNKVLKVQLISLQHVAWPARNRTLTPEVARHILSLHREIYVLLRARDATGARELMSRHLMQIRARRVAEAGAPVTGEAAEAETVCC